MSDIKDDGMYPNVFFMTPSVGEALRTLVDYTDGDVKSDLITIINTLQKKCPEALEVIIGPSDEEKEAIRKRFNERFNK